jgi:hypothetical protein
MSRPYRRRKGARNSVNTKPWLLVYDPLENHPQEEVRVTSFIKGTAWDIYNIRESLKMKCFHEGIIFKHLRSGEFRTVKEVKTFDFRLTRLEPWQTNLLEEKMIITKR